MDYNKGKQTKEKASSEVLDVIRNSRLQQKA